jgi:hypothetical protein
LPDNARGSFRRYRHADAANWHDRQIRRCARSCVKEVSSFRDAIAHRSSLVALAPRNDEAYWPKAVVLQRAMSANMAPQVIKNSGFAAGKRHE